MEVQMKVEVARMKVDQKRLVREQVDMYKALVAERRRAEKKQASVPVESHPLPS